MKDKLDIGKVTPKLWQGARPPKGDALRKAGVHVLVLADDEYQPGEKDFPGVRVIHCPLLDRLEQTPADIACIILAAHEVSDYLQSGATVLSTCRMGLNRSGVISALALCDLGVSPQKAIAAIRKARGRYALSNRTFEAIVKAYPR